MIAPKNVSLFFYYVYFSISVPLRHNRLVRFSVPWRFDRILGYGLPLRGFAITHFGHTTLGSSPLDE
jgi:hypothetical protein